MTSSLWNGGVVILHNNRRPGGDGDRPVNENLRAGRRRDEDSAGGDGNLVTPEEVACFFAEFDET